MMTCDEVYELLTRIDHGYRARKIEEEELSFIDSIIWTEIDSLPESVWMLTSLYSLTLQFSMSRKSNEIDISPLSGLMCLTQLKIIKGNIKNFSALFGLTALTSLELSYTYVKDISVVSRLKKLETLILIKNPITNIGGLSGLTSLKKLVISHNRKIKRFDAIKYLKSLKFLDLQKTNFYDTEILSELKELEYLNLSGTKITNIDQLEGLTRLTTLNLFRTNITEIKVINGLRNLTFLNIARTKVNDIDPLSGLIKLKNLDLRYLTISCIPEKLLYLDLKISQDQNPNRPGIHLYHTNLTDQPIEILNGGADLIQAYYREKNYVPVNECKVIFLGDAEAGKTHAIRRILNKGAYLPKYNDKSTMGIEITVISNVIKGTDIIVNYWDFGGQEIQHSMHRMFLTQRTVYVVFLNARQDDKINERAMYWLENIKSYAPEAPILIVINKIDENDSPKYNEDGITREYKHQIKKTVRLSALKDSPNVFLDTLQGNIDDIILNLPTVSRKIPKPWKHLMEDIRNMANHYLTTSEFMERCRFYKIRDYEEIHDDLVDLFQVIGVSFCYYKNRPLADYIILNPKWLVNALYTIVTNSSIAATNGVITQDNLYSLLNKDMLNGIPIKRVIQGLRYDSNEINYIIGVIRMFRLSYSLKDGSEFFPMLCEGNEKISVTEAVSENAIHFIFRYIYLPSNVLHRLIVELQNDVDYRYVWYSGAVFRNTIQGQTAYICFKKNDLHIYVENKDSFYNPNEYLTPIIKLVRHINKDMGLFADEYVTYKENDVEAEILFEDIKENISHGIFLVYNSKIKKVIDYRDVAQRYEDMRPKMKDTVLYDIVSALLSLQNNMTYYRNSANSYELENSRNRFICDQLRMIRPNCCDQYPGGISENGVAPGERDIVIRDDKGHDYVIYEGLNLRYFEKTNIENHLAKLLNNYNPQGLPYGVLAIYLECDRLKYRNFVDRYIEHIRRYAPQSYICLGEPIIIPMTKGQFLNCIEMCYRCGEALYTIYHIIVRVAE